MVGCAFCCTLVCFVCFCAGLAECLEDSHKEYVCVKERRLGDGVVVVVVVVVVLGEVRSDEGE